MHRCFNRFFDWLLDRLAVDPRQLHHLQRRAAGRKNVLYVLRYPSYIEQALLRRFCVRHNLPLPSAPYLHLRRRASLDSFYLFAKHHRTRVIERLSTELKTLRTPERDASPVFVPVKLFAGRGPVPVPKRLRFLPDLAFLPLGEVWTVLVLIFYRDSLALDLGPVFAPQSDVGGSELLNSLSRSFYRKERKMRGSRLHRHRTVQQIVLSGSQYEGVLERLATSRAETRTEVERRGRKVFSEIAALMGPRTIAFFRMLLHYTFARIFTKVEVRGVEELRAVIEQHPVVLLPRHRSHLDYLFLTYVLYQKHLALPYIAAGNNLNIWPLGPLLRRCGAFFIRRKIENDPLYKIVLNRYLTYLIKQGHEIEFFIEGGRSRTGTVARPRLGLLKYIIRTVLSGARRDVHFVPVGISYERVPEDRSLTSELGGAKKISESLSQLWRLRGFHRVKLHSAVIQFDKAISLREFIATSGLDQPEQTAKLTEALGYAVSQRLNHCSAIPASSVVALFATLQTKPFSAGEFATFVQTVAPLLRSASLTPDLHHLIATPSAAATTLHNSVESGLLCRPGPALSSRQHEAFAPPAEGTLLLFFYKNSALPALFGGAANFVAQDEEERRLLHETFSRFLLLPPYEQWSNELTSVPSCAALAPVVLPFLVLRLALVRSGARSQETRKQSLTAVLDAVSDLLALLPPALAAECGTAVVAEEVAHATPGALLSREEKRVALSFDPKKHCAEEQRLLETLISRALGAIHDKSQEPYTPVCAL